VSAARQDGRPTPDAVAELHCDACGADAGIPCHSHCIGLAVELEDRADAVIARAMTVETSRLYHALRHYDAAYTQGDTA
jgi:hypothetical protein